MTREEAIEVLNGILKLNYREWWDYKCDEAIDMAIEALHREEAEEKGYCHRIKPKQDPISRSDAIEAVMAEGRKVYTSEYANAERVIYEADAVEALAMLPSARPDLISRTELFNKLATVQAPPEANEYKAEVYKIIQSMETEEENDDK